MNVHKRHLSRACLFEFLKIEYLATLSLLPHRKIVVTNSFCAQSRERRPAANATDGRGRHALHAHAQYNTPRGVWKEFEIFSPLMSSSRFTPTKVANVKCIQNWFSLSFFVIL